MVSDDVLDVLVLQNDLNAKVIMLIVIFMYMAFAFWRFQKVEFDTLTNKMFKLGLWVYSRVTLFFFPFMVVTFLHVNTTLEEMIIYISGMYGIVMVMTFAFLIIKGFEKTLDMLGIEKGGMYK